MSLHFSPPYSAFDPVSTLARISSQADWVGIRYVEELTHTRSARNGRTDQNKIHTTRGVMLEILIDGQMTYVATANLSPAGIDACMKKAIALAKASHHKGVFTSTIKHRPAAIGNFQSSFNQNLDKITLQEFTDFLIQCTKHLKVSDKIISAEAETLISNVRSQYYSSSGSNIDQQFLYITTNFAAVAQDNLDTQGRTWNGAVARCYQAGLEAFDKEQTFRACTQVGQEALDLLTAENCPNEKMDLILHPDQMYLQIHESIGHPLELDRILGDERNYAGWSFVHPEDFGRLQYGSKLMNVTFDPTQKNELSSYAYDDGGDTAKKEFLIKDGLLIRGLGGLESQDRLHHLTGSQIDGVANFRSASWNRAPIDRMANINLEPGTSSISEMIASVERGIFMQANKSWSIDDYRNKFQFSCEYARLIENGQLTKVIKNPSYRGSTLGFWNSLKAVGNKHEVENFGTPYCGKGEPSQLIRVGHSSPPCLFSGVEVFGGDI